MNALAWLDERLLSGVEKVMQKSQMWIGLDMFFWAKVFKKSYILCIVVFCLLDVMSAWFMPINSHLVGFTIVSDIFTCGLGWYIWSSNTRQFETDPNRIRRMIMNGLSNPNKITQSCMFNRKFWTVGSMLIPAVGVADIYSVSLFCLVLWMYAISTDSLPVQPSKLKEFLRSFTGQPVPVNP
jgi:hypothetical protein